jgi:hypothetical protein
VFSERELADEYGVADEVNFTAFVRSIGGQLVSEIVPNPEVKNADFLFSSHKVLVELKILESEFGSSKEFQLKLDQHSQDNLEKWGKSPLSLDPRVGLDWTSGAAEIFRPPLARILKKANRQIRSTKEFMRLPDHSGVLMIINNGFRGLPPDQAMALIARSLIGSYSSIDAFVYLTNYLVEIPEDDYARFVWAPLYADRATNDLVAFIDWLGRSWFDFAEELGQSSDDRRTTDDGEFLKATRVLGKPEFPRFKQSPLPETSTK